MIEYVHRGYDVTQDDRCKGVLHRFEDGVWRYVPERNGAVAISRLDADLAESVARKLRELNAAETER